MIRALIFDLCDTVVRTAGVPGLLGLPGVAGRHSAEDLNAWFVHSEKTGRIHFTALVGHKFFTVYKPII